MSESRFILNEDDVEFEEELSVKNVGPDPNFGLTDDEMALPAPVADPHGMFFTDEEKEALTATDNDATIALAFSVATPEKRALMGKNPGKI